MGDKLKEGSVEWAQWGQNEQKLRNDDIKAAYDVDGLKEAQARARYRPTSKKSNLTLDNLVVM
jgi:hypothetical protein